jgi:hypothetical protein
MQQEVRGRKEFVQAVSYAQARSLAPWAVALAWDASRGGFWGWSDAVQASADIAAAQAAERRADLLITHAGERGGHVFRSYLNLRESDARQRAKAYTVRGFVATFADSDGREIWSIYPQGHDVAGQIHAAPARHVEGYAGGLSAA